jgi:UMF1 family MFS transporter
VFAVMIALTGSARGAILSVVVFFAAGAMLLALVDVEEGQRIAREAERG